MRRFFLAILLACFLTGVQAETFEVASIRPHDPAVPVVRGHGDPPDFIKPGGRFEAKGVTVQMLLEWSYDVQPLQHSKLAAWMEKERFDIAASANSNATEANMKAMTRALLVDRFQLKIHPEERTLPALVIAIGKNPPKMVPARDGGTRGLQPKPVLGPNQEVLSYQVTGTRFTVTQLIDVFSRQVDRIIADRTGLKGEFDFSLELSADEVRGGMEASVLIGLLREQLGFDVKSDKIPVEYLVVEETPQPRIEN
jgi:uncharacterized protein (TIGR03435 family)